MAQHSSISFVPKLSIGLPVIVINHVERGRVLRWQPLIGQRPDCARRMIGRDARVQPDVAEKDLPSAALNRASRQPPCKTLFSAACKMKRRVSLPDAREHLAHWSFNA
jgi:hypothetical protein